MMVDWTRRWGNNTKSQHSLLLINKLSFSLQSGTAFSTHPSAAKCRWLVVTLEGADDDVGF